MNRKTLQVIGMGKGLKVKLSFLEDEDDQPRGSYSIIKTNNIENGNLTFEIPIDVTKVILATNYRTIDYAIVGQKLEDKIVTRIWYDKWIGYPKKCSYCGVMIEHAAAYEIHQCFAGEVVK